jgi:zinc protease
MVDRKEQPNIVDTVELDLKLKPYQYFTLDNGVPVYAVNAGEQDVLMAELVFYAGNWFEEKNIVAATANYLLNNGTTNKTAYAINEHFDYYGSHLNRYCYNETASLTLHSLTKHLEHLLPVIAELFTESTFPEHELAIYKQNQKQKLAVNLKKSEFIGNRIIDELLFGRQHPYGKYTSLEEYDAVQREEAIKFYNQFYTNGNCILFVAGKLPSNLEHQLNKNFGALPFNKHPVLSIEHKPISTSAKQHKIVNDPNGVQGAIRIARPFPNRHHPDFIKVQVLNNIFGGYFGSRLMSNIREDKGYTYGIHSFLQNHIQQSAWVISTEAGRDVCEATITEVYKEMQRLREEPVSEEELHLVRNYMMGSILGDLDGPFHIISRWKNYILNNLTEAYFYNSIETIKNISAQELIQLAQKYLNAEDFYELTVI